MEEAFIDPRSAALAKAMADETWRSKLEADFERGKNNLPISTPRNILAILQQDPRWAGVIALDVYASRVYKRVVPPFAQSEIGEWTDEDDMRLRVWLDLEYRLKSNVEDLQNAIAWVADQNREHDLRDYLDMCAVKWDGQERVRDWLLTYLGADALDDDDPAFVDETIDYYRRVGMKWMVAAVARAYKPGCRVDNMLILEGGEGLGKSTAFRILGQKWFADALLNPADKEYNALIQGKWIVEMPELEAMNKAESATMKRFLTQHVDRFRTWYGRRAGDVPRGCVFCGTVNYDTYIKDDSGGRRYWPVFVTLIDLPRLEADRDQLWGEAVTMFRRGVRWWEEPHDQALFRAQQERRHQRDPYQSVIGRYLRSATFLASEITTAELMTDCLEMDPGRMTRNEEMRVGQALRRLGWTRTRKRIGGEREYVYVRPDRAGSVPTVPT